ncbi:DUF2628 domain-containing protein [Sneathiella aquimaris]|uniref:DUF2628 domain-containing protein n=1 Tax=Sneathiella aquimaris TaxID=2599305 RepID=UPI00146F0E61|nr:DUF2628 domain-containing protein [Sneathiella aquimaris]
MKTYSVFYHMDRPLDGAGLIVDRDSFHWLAFMLPALYALMNRLWLPLILYVAVIFLTTILLNMLSVPQTTAFSLSLGTNLIFAWAVPLLKAEQRRKAGYQEAAPVMANTRDGAERLAIQALKDQLYKASVTPVAPDLAGTSGKENDYNN